VTAQPGGGEPALDPQGRRYDQLRLVGIAATGYHGAFDHERRDGQLFRADVVLHLDTRPAAAGDDLARTVDYGVLATQVAAVLGGEPCTLIETVAERIAATALAHPLVAAVDVSVHKPQAPVGVPFEDIVVTIRRDRSTLPVAARWTAPAEQAASAASAASAVEAVAVEAVAAAVAAAVPSAAVPSAAVPAAVVPAGPAGVVAPGPGAAGPSAPVPAGRFGTDPGADSGADRRERDRLEQAPASPVEVVLGIGSNLGPSQDTLRDAVAALAAIEDLDIVAVSPLARTAPVGGPGQPDFLNAVVIVRTSLSPRALLRATQAVEDAFGRERVERWGPRTLDIDLIVYGATVAVTDELELPHPRAHERAFVLQPWAQIAPAAVLPGLGGGPVAALAATAPDRAGIRWLALDWLSAPPHPVHPAAPPATPGPEPDADLRADPAPAPAPAPDRDPDPEPDLSAGPDPAVTVTGAHPAVHRWTPDPAREPDRDGDRA
jgi:dihydroneopterin aldolase/2-amino-4-hydroxy-6-hydroxymethyldihydropteridine diphosphokinase